VPLLLASFGCGLVFGIGLLVSGMTDPLKVLGFLDILGAWDATLAFVMAGAVAVSSAGFWLARRQERPLLANVSLWPTRADIDARLVIGGAFFGLGWGLVGLCPGPALVNLAGLGISVFAFVAAMALAMLSFDYWQQRSISARVTAKASAVGGA
jgi:uncharacterized protein